MDHNHNNVPLSRLSSGAGVDNYSLDAGVDIDPSSRGAGGVSTPHPPVQRPALPPSYAQRPAPSPSTASSGAIAAVGGGGGSSPGAGSRSEPDNARSSRISDGSYSNISLGGANKTAMRGGGKRTESTSSSLGGPLYEELPNHNDYSDPRFYFPSSRSHSAGGGVRAAGGGEGFSSGGSGGSSGDGPIGGGSAPASSSHFSVHNKSTGPNGIMLNGGIPHHPHPHLHTTARMPRKRKNPLYNEAELERDEAKPLHKMSDYLVLIVASLLVIALVALVALVIAILLAVGAIKTDSDPVPRYTYRDENIQPNETDMDFVVRKLEQLERDYKALQQHGSSISALQGNVAQINTQLESFSAQMDQLEASQESVMQALSTLERIPGPPGVGNLSACESQLIETGSSQMSWSTPSVPTIQEHNDYVIFGITCTVVNGASAVLQYSDLTDETTNDVILRQFNCLCEKVVTDSSYCSLLYWRCPRIS